MKSVLNYHLDNIEYEDVILFDEFASDFFDYIYTYIINKSLKYLAEKAGKEATLRLFQPRSVQLCVFERSL